MQLHLDNYNNYKTTDAYSEEELEEADAWYLEITSEN